MLHREGWGRTHSYRLVNGMCYNGGQVQALLLFGKTQSGNIACGGEDKSSGWGPHATLVMRKGANGVRSAVREAAVL
jgi:hypothetical protein